MIFKKIIKHNIPAWYCGVYKISEYNYFNGERCAPFYQVYYLVDDNWGEYLDRFKQYNTKLTFKEAEKLAEEHAKHNTPSNRQVKQAVIQVKRLLE